MAKKVYLVYDFDELCGVFSSLSAAKKAVALHLSHIKKYTEKKSRQLGFGEVDFEVFEDSLERKWVYSVLAKTREKGEDLHRRRVMICEYNQNEYFSTMKRLAEKMG